jgi:RNA polymerase sigma factor (TIGR02999 family)
MTEVTQILAAIEQGDAQVAGQLLPLVYTELRRLAAQKLAREAPGQTLEPTALVHEAYLRLVDVDKAQNWDSRGHFFAAAAEAMRRILVDGARRKGAEVHGGRGARVALAEGDWLSRATPDEIVALDDSLSRLSGTETRDGNKDAASFTSQPRGPWIVWADGQERLRLRELMANSEQNSRRRS